MGKNYVFRFAIDFVNYFANWNLMPIVHDDSYISNSPLFSFRIQIWLDSTSIGVCELFLFLPFRRSILWWNVQIHLTIRIFSFVDLLVNEYTMLTMWRANKSQ